MCSVAGSDVAVSWHSPCGCLPCGIPGKIVCVSIYIYTKGFSGYVRGGGGGEGVQGDLVWNPQLKTWPWPLVWLMSITCRTTWSWRMFPLTGIVRLRSLLLGVLLLTGIGVLENLLWRVLQLISTAGLKPPPLGVQEYLNWSALRGSQSWLRESVNRLKKITGLKIILGSTLADQHHRYQNWS